jgi:hypothetical protein
MVAMKSPFFFCRRYQQTLKLIGEHRGFQKFQERNGKIHQCIKVIGGKTWKCSKLEVN